jgi:putative ABC transport system permease protein
MLAYVAQRSREFAIRVVFGAQHKDILIMVLAQSFLLGFLGALIGVIISLFTAPVVTSYLSAKIPEASSVQPAATLQGIFYPLLVCGISGLIAGTIPALKVRKLDILDVMR